MQPTNPYAAPAADEGFAPPPERTGPFRRILNTGLHLYFTNLVPITIITLIVWTPLELFHSYLQYFVFEPDDFRASFRLQQFLDSFFGIIALGAVIAIQDASVRGEKITIWESLDEGFTAWPRLFWSRFLRGFLLLLAFLALIIPFFYYFVRLLLVEQVAVIEHAGVVDSLKRAHELSTKRYWLLFGIMFLSYSLIGLVAILLNLPLGLFPEIDHWLLSAALALPIDILMQIPTCLLVAAYFEFLHDRHPSNPSNQEAPLPSVSP